MRRKDKEITERSAIEAIIKKSRVCRLGLFDGHAPYIVPLCFGYKDETLYFHSSMEGKKLEIIKTKQTVCFEFDIDVRVLKAEEACSWSMKYKSVIGFGKAALIENIEERQKALDIIMGQYSDQKYDFLDMSLEGIALIKVEIEHMTGKQSGF